MTYPPNSNSQRALEMMQARGPLETLRALIAENDARLLGPELDCGAALVAARTVAYDLIAGQWAECQLLECGYDRPFALVALGGTGREEMTPRSDNDYALLFDDDLESNNFLLKLQAQTVHSGEFEERHGFRLNALPYSLDDASTLAGKELNAFVDMRAVHDPCGLAAEFRTRIRATYDPFQHFLHIRQFWQKLLERMPACERIDHFDIKNDALRLFQSGIWTLAGKEFRHSAEVYRSLVDARDLDAYYFLLRIRGWVHLRYPAGMRGGLAGNHPEDIMRFDDFTAFGEMLGPHAAEAEKFEFAEQVRGRLLSARRRVAGFARGTIERELREGRPAAAGSPILFGAGGLHDPTAGERTGGEERSSAALSLLLTAQHYGIHVDPAELQATFQNAGDWLVRTPEVAALFYEPRGSLADSFAFLSQLDGAEDRLFPGRARFEASLDNRVLLERREMRGALELRKLRTLEQFIGRGGAERGAPGDAGAGISPESAAALLDADHLAAVKLAIKTKRLALTAEDQAARDNLALPLHERFASGFSGIPLEEYYHRIGAECGFNAETVAAAIFLIANRRAFKTLTSSGQNDAEQVARFRVLCGSEQRLRALYLFTCADRSEWEAESNEPVRWFLIRELYLKTVRAFRNITASPASALLEDGYATEDREIVRDFGEDLFAGLYQRHVNKFGAHLVRLANRQTQEPRAALLHEGAALILGIAARDFPGLAACISGALTSLGFDLRQAHCFSAMNYGLALDFFHVAKGGGGQIARDFPRRIEEAVTGRLYLDNVDESTLPELAGKWDLYEPHPGKFRLRLAASIHDPGLVHALCWKLYRHLEADIHGLGAEVTRTGPVIVIHCSLKPWMSIDVARQILRGQIRSGD